MPIIGIGTVSTPNVYPLASDIIAMSSRDMANVLGDNPIVVDYVNRIQLELLRLSRWRFLLSEPQQFVTVANSGSYQLSNATPGSGVVASGLALTDLDIIKNNSVINRTVGYSLYPTGSQPISLYFNNVNYPTEWVLHPSGQLDLWPSPNAVYTIEFRYYKTRPTVVLSTDYLVIPAQYQDVVVAGVNYLVSMYLAKDNPAARGDAGYWKGLYEDGKRQLVRDANLFPRVDFLSPDATTQRTVMSTSPIETSIP